MILVDSQETYLEQLFEELNFYKSSEKINIYIGIYKNNVYVTNYEEDYFFIFNNNVIKISSNIFLDMEISNLEINFNSFRLQKENTEALIYVSDDINLKGKNYKIILCSTREFENLLKKHIRDRLHIVLCIDTDDLTNINLTVTSNLIKHDYVCDVYLNNLYNKFLKAKTLRKINTFN